MKKSTILLIVILVVGTWYFFFYGNRGTSNERFEETQTEEQTQIDESYQSKIFDATTFPTETREDIPELDYMILIEGEGDQVAIETSTVVANYRGWLASDGTIFDSSFNNGSQTGIQFSLQQVIEGWTRGVSGMKIGEVRRIFIPSDLGYGENGTSRIPANADLIFDVELLQIN